MRRALAIHALLGALLPGCGSDGAPESSVVLAGVWTATLDGLPPKVVRADQADIAQPRAVGRVWRFTGAPPVLRACQQDVRDPDVDLSAVDPCDCPVGAPVSDCGAGEVRVDDVVADGSLVAVTLVWDDARADEQGVMMIQRTSAGDLLALHLESVLEDEGRRPAMADGLQGALLAGSDGLQWMRRRP